MRARFGGGEFSRHDRSREIKSHPRSRPTFTGGVFRAGAPPRSAGQSPRRTVRQCAPPNIQTYLETQMRTQDRQSGSRSRGGSRQRRGGGGGRYQDSRPAPAPAKQTFWQKVAAFFTGEKKQTPAA